MARNDLPGNIAHYYLHDHLGSARVTTNEAGASEKQTDYSPYGGEIWTSGTNTNHYKFTGKERDAESGLDNFGARFDASALGRFMSPDAGRAEQGDPQTWNRYAYVTNNPLSYLDPNGRERVGSYYLTSYSQVSDSRGLWSLLGLFSGHGLEHDEGAFKPRFPSQPEPKGPWSSGEPNIHHMEDTPLEGAWYKATDVQIYSINVDFKDGHAIITTHETHEGVIYNPKPQFFAEKDSVEIEDPKIDPAKLRSLTNNELQLWSTKPARRVTAPFIGRYLKQLRKKKSAGWKKTGRILRNTANRTLAILTAGRSKNVAASSYQRVVGRRWKR
jgi:RHS repeat-associated protein